VVDARDRRDESEAAQRIVVATESLLAERPLQDVSVADILEEANVARGTFYLWFRSKHDVVIYANQQIVQGIATRFGDLATRRGDDVGRLRDALSVFVAAWREHGPILAASGEVWRADPELREAWIASLQPMVELVTGVIAPFVPSDGPKPELLAHALIWMNARTTYMAAEGMVPVGLDDELVDVLTYVWLRVVAPR
jgi:AcrR family transcriptional regulator